MTSSVPSTQTQRSSGPPGGYCRAKIYNRSILVKTLIDSGNLFGDLISEQFAKTLKLEVFGNSHQVGTASKNGKVTVLGKTRPFFLFLEGSNSPVQITPYVVRDLAHPVNLGQDFLRRNYADLSFRSQDVQLKLKGRCIALQPSNMTLTRSSIDTRIDKVLETWRNAGNNPPECNDMLDARINAVSKESDSPQTLLPDLY